MIGAEIEGLPPGGVLFRTSRTGDPSIQVHGAKLTRPPYTLAQRIAPSALKLAIAPRRRRWSASRFLNS